MENLNYLQQAADPWVRYRTMLDLLELPSEDEKVIEARQQMLLHPLVQGLIDELQHWPGTVISSHKSAGQLYHKLAFLADIGLTKSDQGLSDILSQVKAHPTAEGLLQLPVNISVNYGGSGKELWAWALCDAPLLLYSAAKIGGTEEISIQKGVVHLKTLARENGWPCVVSKELGNFRGPGRKTDPCPDATLIMLKLLALFPQEKDSSEAQLGIECLLHLWEQSRELHPYMFYMGTDFRKLKAPFIWYDLLHVAEVISQFDFARRDERFVEMLELINSKADAEGLFTPESEWQAWKSWEFGQKKRPSAWLTFLVYRINYRCGRE